MIAELFYMDTTIWVKTPYSKVFVTELKEVIETDYRYWNDDEKVWVVNYSYEEEILILCSKHFNNVQKYGKKRLGVSPSAQSLPEYKTLFLIPNAPKEVVLAAYRALSHLYHPDVNKSPDATTKMKEINIAKDKIMRGE